MSTRQTGTEGATSNPLLEDWATPFGLPPFDRITPDHFRPAFDRATAEHRAEIAAIAGDLAEPTFANTVDAFERAGRTLDRVSAVFFSLAGAHTSDALQAIEREIAPVLARHRSAIYLDAALFRRVDALLRDATTSASRPSRRGCWSAAFGLRAGRGRLDGSERERLAAIDERLATLGTRFSQNVLADERAWVMVLETEDDLAGLPDFLRAAAARAAAEPGPRGQARRSRCRARSIEPFLQFSARRDLRERAFAAWTGRGENGGDTDNRAIIAETVAPARRAGAAPRLPELRAFPARRHDGEDAPRPRADLLRDVWTPARARAGAERDGLQADRRGGGRQLRARSPRTGATTPRRCAGPSTTSTRPRSSRTCQLDSG